MTNPGNTGGDGGDGGQQGGSGTGSTATGSSQGAGTGTGGAGGETSTETWSDADAWKALAEELGLTPADVKKKLEHSRTWEKRAKDNTAAAGKAQTLEQQVSEMRQQIADRDERDVKNAQRTASTELRAGLAEAGLDRAEIAEALELVDASKLLDDDNEPDEKKIAAMAKRLSKLAGRAQPDRDQGAGNGGSGDGGGFSMNNWVRGQVASKRGR